MEQVAPGAPSGTPNIEYDNREGDKTTECSQAPLEYVTLAVGGGLLAQMFLTDVKYHCTNSGVLPDVHLSSAFVLASQPPLI